MKEKFSKFAQKTSELAGSIGAFGIAIGIIIIWATSGPFFGFSEVWQIVINTTTTIITFIMIFLVQSAQNRDSKATHLKLDELLKSQKNAKNKLIDIEEQSDKKIEREKKKEKRAKTKK